jgi:hypothetical protein
MNSDTHAPLRRTFCGANPILSLSPLSGQKPTTQATISPLCGAVVRRDFARTPCPHSRNHRPRCSTSRAFFIWAFSDAASKRSDPYDHEVRADILFSALSERPCQTSDIRTCSTKASARTLGHGANLGGLTRLRIELSKLAAEPIAVRDVRRLHLLKSFDLLATEAADAALQ